MTIPAQLETCGPIAAWTATGTGNVYTLGCNGGNFQNWYTGFGVPILYDAQTGLCLDSNYNGNVYTLGCNGGNYQNWYY